MNALPGHDPGALRGVLEWVDERFGPIQRLWGFSLLAPEPRWWVYGCDLARLPVGTWCTPEHFGSAGASIDPDEALQRALGEAVERYSGLVESAATTRELLAPADNPLADLFPVCAPDEACPLSFKETRLEAPVTHVRMQRLDTGREALAPAGHALLGFSPQPPEPMVALPISTGLAFHVDLATAIWKGLCEVAERDAMMLAWLTRRPLRPIDLSSAALPEDLATRLERLKSVRLSAYLFDMSTDFRVPTVFCLVTGERYPYTVVGAACHGDVAAACAKALDEAASVRLGLTGEKWSKTIPSLDSFTWVRQLEHHLALYAGWPSSPALDFLIHGDQAPLPFSDFAQQDWRQTPVSLQDLTALATRLEEADLTVLWTDLTAPEAEGFGRVVKVVVPQMVPMSQDHNARWLGTPRLLRHADLARTSPRSFNPFPHPFA
jgi:ribosomal protein S12 methylthiotransferase accessory factor